MSVVVDKPIMRLNPIQQAVARKSLFRIHQVGHYVCWRRGALEVLRPRSHLV
jgi:hypothetical protein